MNLACYNPTNRLSSILFPDLNELLGSAASQHELPATRMFHDQERHYLHIDLPGVAKEAVKIQVQDNQLTVEAEREVRCGEQTQKVSYRRSFTLSDEINANAIVAEHSDGVLRLTLPKREEAKPRQIEIKVS